MRISLGLVLAMTLAGLGAGCGAEANYCATWVRQSWTTERAWHDRKWMYEGIACESSFKAGFKAGYRFANCGGDSCQPPGPSHFWFANGMTEGDQREAQAWCDGFTHGTLAAQQDGATAASSLDAQTAQPPEGVPDVYYYSNAGASGPIGSPQSIGQFEPGQFAPGEFAPGQFPSMQPPSGMMPVAPGGAAAATSGPSSWSNAAAPADPAYPPAAPPSESVDVSTGNPGAPAVRSPSAPAFSGIGSLRTTTNPESFTTRHPAPAPMPEISLVPPAPAPPPTQAPISGSGPALTASPKNASESAPATQPSPSIRSAPTSQWELPLIRE
jgi:hypothetical protein